MISNPPASRDGVQAKFGEGRPAQTRASSADRSRSGCTIPQARLRRRSGSERPLPPAALLMELLLEPPAARRLACRQATLACQHEIEVQLSPFSSCYSRGTSPGAVDQGAANGGAISSRRHCRKRCRTARTKMAMEKLCHVCDAYPNNKKQNRQIKLKQQSNICKSTQHEAE